MAEVASANRANTTKIVGVLDGADDYIVYKFRGGRTAPQELNISLDGDLTATVQVRLCPVGSTAGATGVSIAAAATDISAQLGQDSNNNGFRLAGDMDVVVYVSAYTSGSCVCTISASF